MPRIKVNATGQLTLPADVLAQFGVGPGSAVEIVKADGPSLVLKAASKKSDITEVFGLLEQKGTPSVSIEEMNEAIAQGWAGEME